MKKIFTALLILFTFLLIGCADDTKIDYSSLITFLEFSETEHTMNIGDSYILPIVFEGKGDVVDIIFTADEDGLVTFDEELITATTGGYVQITAKAKYNDNLSDSILITILDPNIRQEYLRFSLRTTALRVGDSMPIFLANLKNVGATSLDEFIFEIGDSSIIEIDEDYNIVGLKEGSSTLTIIQRAYRINTGTITIYVGHQSTKKTTLGEPNDEPLVLYLEDNVYTIEAGVDKQLKVLGAKNYQRYSYVSSDSNILCVSDEGMLMGIKEGTVIIRVSSKDAVAGTTNQIIVNVVGDKKVNYIETLLKVALAEQGYTEWTGNNDTKYGEWNNCNYEAWCAIFVSWCANNAGIPSSILYRSISVTVYMDTYIGKEEFYYKEDYTPVAGDLIIFKGNGSSHVGIVVKSDSSTVYTIEGNTSNMVARRSYDLMNNTITGYCHPSYGQYSYDPQIEWK